MHTEISIARPVPRRGSKDLYEPPILIVEF